MITLKSSAKLKADPNTESCSKPVQWLPWISPMLTHHVNCLLHHWIKAVIFTASLSANTYASDPECPVNPDSCTATHTTQPEPFKAMVVGENRCYLVQAYFPKDKLEAMLPERLAIPDDETMKKYYPQTILKPDAHPFMLSICHGANIHDVYTKINVPEQEEIMFSFPVLYQHDDGEMYLSSYVPVLYLDSLQGVIGGLFFGLRKEYHSEMTHGKNADDIAWWRVADIFEASFEPSTDAGIDILPGFFEQTYANPFVTISYPTPVPMMFFYQATVHPNKTSASSETFFWNYRETTTRSNKDTSAVYSEYAFSMSRPMRPATFFKR